MSTQKATDGQNALLKVLDFTTRRASSITAGLVVLSVVAFCVLPGVDRENFFDENALLVHSADPTFQTAPGVLQTTADFITSLQHLDHLAVVSRLIPELAKRELLAYTLTHNSTRHPGTVCRTLHTIVRSPRGEGKESILIATPIGVDPTAPGAAQQTAGGAAFATGLGYGLVTHLRTVNWLAKDLIWVLPDARCGALESMQHWLSVYYFKDGFRSTSRFGRAGRIQQAVVVDVRAARWDTAEVLVEGEGGQLPRLDMYWVVKVLADTHMGVRAGLQASRSSLLAHLPELGWDRGARDQLARLAVMSEFVWRQAVGLPSGPHAAFKNVGADAVTLRLTSQEQLLPGGAMGGEGWVEIGQLSGAGQALELIVRSCSNLLERLHHSYTLYLQTSDSRFVTVDLYIIPMCALLLALLLQAGAVKSRVDAEYARQAPSEERLVAHIGSWMASMRAVLLPQAVAAATGVAARLAASPGGLPLVRLSDTLQQCWEQRESVGQWFGGAGGEGDNCGALVSGALLLLVVLAKAALIASRWGAGGWKGDMNGGDEEVPARWDWDKVQVVLLSDLAVGMAAVGCINWALAFLWLLLLVPLAVLSQPALPLQAPTTTPRWLLSAAVALLASPALLLQVLLATAQPAGATATQALQWWLQESHPVAFTVFWLFYLPVWLLASVRLFTDRF